MPDRYLLESSLVDGYLLEDGTGVLLLDAPVVGWTHIAKVSGVTASAIAKIDGVAVASIAKVSGTAV